MSTAPQAPLEGTLHTYAPSLTAFEHSPSSTSIILFIGGLTDGYQTVPLASFLPTAASGWGVAQVLLSSSYTGFGVSSITQDAEEIGQAVQYFRARGKERIILFGHSTGCQDIIAYFHLSSSPKIEGAVLQAPVSDREYLSSKLPPTISSAHPDSAAEVTPRLLSSAFGKTLILRERWESLASPPESDEVDLIKSEDFFSSDLSDTRLSNVFKPVNAPLLLLLSEKDECYPGSVDPAGLLPRFQEALEEKWRSSASGLVKGADHVVSGEESRNDVLHRLGQFLESLST